jgi:superoxide dismutase, Cu-Zn family
MIRTLTIAAAALAASACMSSGEPRSSTSMNGANSSLAAADGSVRGTARLREGPDGVAVHVEAEGLAPGTHGIHVHTTGRCDAPDFASAGPHWNPTARQHGRQNPQGAHHGDLPNISIGSDGRGTLDFTLPEARFVELFDADGAALVVHANADDERSDPSGNSGGRIACGVIARS